MSICIQTINQAMRKGEEIDTTKKCKWTICRSRSHFHLWAYTWTVTDFCSTDTAAANKQRTAAKDTAKLDRETEELHREFIASLQPVWAVTTTCSMNICLQMSV